MTLNEESVGRVAHHRLEQRPHVPHPAGLTIRTCAVAPVRTALVRNVNGVGSLARLLYGLLFGALISPTDPIAVMGAPSSPPAQGSGDEDRRRVTLQQRRRRGDLSGPPESVAFSPIAVVVAGLLIRNYGRQWAMSETTRERLDSFWELLDELLNAVLFELIDLEVLVLSFHLPCLMAGLVAVPVALTAWWATVLLQVGGFILVREFGDKTVRILTWGGLRGGISVASALFLPSGPERNAVVTITYVVVVFSILVQGLTISRVVGGPKGWSSVQV